MSHKHGRSSNKHGLCNQQKNGDAINETCWYHGHGVSSGEELWVYGVLFQQMDTNMGCGGRSCSSSSL